MTINRIDFFMDTWYYEGLVIAAFISLFGVWLFIRSIQNRKSFRGDILIVPRWLQTTTGIIFQFLISLYIYYGIKAGLIG